MDDLISRQDAIRLAEQGQIQGFEWQFKKLCALPSAEPERLTDDDFETIRIHLNAYKEKLCNQKRWKEAEEYQRIIDRFMAFASTQPRKGKWELCGNHHLCSECDEWAFAKWDEDECDEVDVLTDFCPNCGCRMEEGDSDE